MWERTNTGDYLPRASRLLCDVPHVRFSVRQRENMFTCFVLFFFLTLYVSGLTARNPLVTNVLMEGKQYDNNKCKRETEKEICSKSQLVRDRSIKPVHPESSNIWTRGCPPPSADGMLRERLF